MGVNMHIRLKGLVRDKHRDGTPRYRVRHGGRRIDIPGPDDPHFMDHYAAARRGEKFTPPDEPKAVLHSLDWLVGAYLDHLGDMVAAGLSSPLTARQRRSQLTRLADFKEGGHRYGGFDMKAPQAAFVRFRDSMLRTPGEADNCMKSARAMYKWAIERGLCSVNPVVGVGKIHRARGGATPWTAADLKAYRERHPPGTMGHLYLTLLMFTGCRIGDALWLGRGQEIRHDGRTWLEWQPSKAGSAPVSIPMLEPLYKATRAMTIIGPAYVLRESGQPFASTEGLRNRFGKWCEQAGLSGLSSHGVRKALASLLSEQGMSDAQIGAILAHTNAQTTATYTVARNRRVMAAAALTAVESKLGDW